MVGSLALLLLTSMGWALKLSTEWGTDFGVYYVGAASFCKKYRLYLEHFDHKGPAYYFFLNVIGFFISYGAKQAVISVWLTVLFYFIGVGGLSALFLRSAASFFWGILLAACSLYLQPTNASIALFQTGFLLWFFYFLKRYFDDGKMLDLCVGALLLSLAAFVRVDSLGFGALYLLIPFYFRESWFRKLMIAGTAQFLMLLICYLFFAVVYGYPLRSFFEQNVIFNFIYKEANYQGGVTLMSYAPSLKIILKSGLGLLLLLGGYFVFVCRNKLHQPLFMLSVLCLSALLFLITGSTKNYHLFILYAGILFVMVGCAEHVLKQRVMQIVMVIFAIWISYNLSPGIVAGLEMVKGSGSFLLPNELDVLLVEQASDSDRNFYLIDNRSWIYLFSGKVPLIPVNPSVLYNYNGEMAGGVAQSFILAHENMCSDSGAFIAIRKAFVAGAESERLQEIYKRSDSVDTIVGKGMYGSFQEYDLRIVR
jgi:hypothetical protein